MTQKKSKKDEKKTPELTDAEKIESLLGQVNFFRSLVADRTEQLKQAVETIKAQNKTIELLNQSLNAMNKTNELLRKE